MLVILLMSDRATVCVCVDISTVRIYIRFSSTGIITFVQCMYIDIVGYY